jgi:hypothetical protein
MLLKIIKMNITEILKDLQKIQNLISFLHYQPIENRLSKITRRAFFMDKPQPYPHKTSLAHAALFNRAPSRDQLSLAEPSMPCSQSLNKRSQTGQHTYCSDHACQPPLGFCQSKALLHHSRFPVPVEQGQRMKGHEPILGIKNLNGWVWTVSLFEKTVIFQWIAP